jgi:hypothetical protein
MRELIAWLLIAACALLLVLWIIDIIKSKWE